MFSSGHLEFDGFEVLLECRRGDKMVKLKK